MAEVPKFGGSKENELRQLAGGSQALGMRSKAASVGHSSAHFRRELSVKDIKPCVERASISRASRVPRNSLSCVFSSLHICLCVRALTQSPNGRNWILASGMVPLTAQRTQHHRDGMKSLVETPSMNQLGNFCRSRLRAL